MLDILLENFSQTSWALVFILLIVGIVTVVSRSAGITWRGPGPWGIPLLGYYPFLRADFHIHFMELAKKHGDPFLLSLGGKLYLHLGSHKSLREVFVTQSDCFASRCLDFSVFNYLFGDGIFHAKGEAWRVWRKFLGKSMRELGIGPKEQLKGPVLDAVQTALDALKNSKGSPVEMNSVLSSQCIEVVRRLILGSEVSHETSQKLSSAYLQTFGSMLECEVLLRGTIARWLLLPFSKGYKSMLEGKKEMTSILYKILNDHKKNFTDDQPENLIDIYLCEKKALEQKKDPQAKYFTDEALISSLILVYGDGSTSIAALITDYMRVLASKPDLQEEIYQEIANEIGTEKLPTYEDRLRLPFTCSAMKEVERCICLLSVIPSLESSRDTTVFGIFVPKGTVALFNVYSIHKDPEVYKQPERFDPRRFMSDDEGKRSKVDLPVLFGLGKRACAGESLVMTEVFSFVSAILQNFTLQLDEQKANGTDKNGGSDIQSAIDCRILASPRRH